MQVYDITNNIIRININFSVNDLRTNELYLSRSERKAWMGLKPCDTRAVLFHNWASSTLKSFHEFNVYVAG